VSPLPGRPSSFFTISFFILRGMLLVECGGTFGGVAVLAASCKSVMKFFAAV
jgi:hypothetical protein